MTPAKLLLHRGGVLVLETIRLAAAILVANLSLAANAAGAAPGNRYILFLFTNPAAGQESEYRHWYASEEIPQLLQIPGVAAVQHLHLVSPQLTDRPHSYTYAAKVDLETPNLRATMAAIRAARDGGRILSGPLLAKRHGEGMMEQTYGEGSFVPLAAAAASTQRPTARTHYALMFFTNPVKGREQDYHRWYDGQEVSHLLAIPGVVSAQRYTLSDEQLRDSRDAHTYDFMVMLDVASDDIQKTLASVRASRAAGTILRSDTMETGFTDGTFEPVTARLTRKP